MLSQLVNLNLFAFLLVFARVGTALSLMPGFGSQQIFLRARVAFAMAVSLLLTPSLLPILPSEPQSISLLFLLLSSEILIGTFLGTVPRIIFGALQTAGTMLSMMASMANMFSMDAIAEQQSSVFSSFLGTLAITLVFVTNTHHLMLAAIVESYDVFDPARGPLIGDMADFLAHSVADSFRIGIQISSPLIVSGMAYYLGLGIMGKLMPQLPVFFFGMPIQISMQIYLIMVTLPAMMMVFMRYFIDTIQGFTAAWGA